MSIAYPESSTSVNPSVVPPLVPVLIPAPGDGPLDTQTRLTSVSLLSEGIDTLRLSWWVAWPFLKSPADSRLFRQLEEAKILAQEKDVPSFPVSLAGYEWNVQRSGAKDYPFHLVRGDVHMLMNRRDSGKQIPNVRLEIGSVSCWSPGFQVVYDEIVKMVELLGGAVIDETVSEVHLTADAIGCPVSSVLPEGRGQWICRADKFGSFSERTNFSGITFGKGKLMLRVYDKVLELRGRNNSQKQALFADIWGVSRYDEKAVTRVEFQLRRPFLRELEAGKYGFKVRNLSDLRQCMDSLWQYLTMEWARLASSVPDRKNRHQDRVEICPFWSFIQSAKFAGECTVQRVKRYFRKDIDRLVSMASGCLMSIAAMTGDIADVITDIEGSLVSAQEVLTRNLLSFLQSDGPEFRRRLCVKYNEAHGIPISAGVPF